jgi:suppressor for copper-sensitivity B
MNNVNEYDNRLLIGFQMMTDRMLRNVLRIIVMMVATLCNASTTEAVASTVRESVSVVASVSRISETEIDLTVTATIEPGYHIYSLLQKKPLLASRIDANSSGRIESIGGFQTLNEPRISVHPQFNVEVLEYHGVVAWKSRIVLKPGQGDTKITGSFFAQACKEDRCYPPQTYQFEAEVPPNSINAPSKALTSSSTLASASATVESEQAKSNVEFSLAEFQVLAQKHKTQSIWAVVPLAFIAGFLLNFMPCVLPVVGLKLLSFAQQARLSRRRVLLLNLAYTGGLVSVMLVLASLAVFAGFGWGEQFSSPAFTISLTAIVFAFSLSLLGVWEVSLPGFVGAIGGKTSSQGYAGAFSKGVLSTLLATPCSGPFLGAALAWAVSQPSYLTYLVFLSVGLGMTSPFLVVGVYPAVIRFLPRPGNWMIAFKQVMGFVMLITVVYLLSFLPIASVVPTVLLLLGVGAGLWIVGLVPAYESLAKHLMSWTFALALIAGTASISFGWLNGVMQNRFERAAQRLLAESNASVAQNRIVNSKTSKIKWQEYSPEKLESLLNAGESVFIDFTADWCLTCKANEAAAIETPEFVASLQAGKVIALRADKTEPNPDADALLRKLGNAAASIPFYAVFSAKQPTEPVLLDGLYSSPEPFVKAIQQSTRYNAPDKLVSISTN